MLMFIQIFTRIREMCISHSAEKIYLLPRRTGEKEKKAYRERRTNLVRDVDRPLDSLGTERSWNVLWKLLWKALRGTRTELGPRVRFCYTRAATTMRGAAPSCPLKPRGALHVLVLLPLFISLSFPLCANESRFLYIESASFFIIVIISVVDTLLDRVLLAFSLLVFFPLRTFILLGRISYTDGIFLDRNFFATACLCLD